MKQFTSKTQKIGKFAENVCEKYLRKNDFMILETNFTLKQGEIDIIAFKEGSLYFVEVKSCVSYETLEHNVSYETYNPLNNIDKHKIYKLRNMVELYLSKYVRVSYETFQCDVCSVYIDPKLKNHRICYIENAF